MAESTWLEHLQAFGQQLTAVGQQAAAQHGRLTDWFLHQQGLFALGESCCLYTHSARVTTFLTLVL